MNEYKQSIYSLFRVRNVILFTTVRINYTIHVRCMLIKYTTERRRKYKDQCHKNRPKGMLRIHQIVQFIQRQSGIT